MSPVIERDPNSLSVLIENALKRFLGGLGKGRSGTPVGYTSPSAPIMGDEPRIPLGDIAFETIAGAANEPRRFIGPPPSPPPKQFLPNQTSPVMNLLVPSHRPLFAPSPQPIPPTPARPRIVAPPPQVTQAPRPQIGTLLMEEEMQPEWMLHPQTQPQEQALPTTQPTQPVLQGGFPQPPPPIHSEVEAKLREIAEMSPKTVEEVAGPRPRVSQEMTPTEVLRNIGWGIIYGGAEGTRAHRQKLQERLDQEYQQNLELALSRMKEKQKAEYTILNARLERQKQLEEGYSKFLEKTLEANPDALVTNPNLMAAAMRLWQMDQKGIEDYLKANQQPDGTYKFGMTTAERNLYAAQSRARLLKPFFKEMLPNLTDDELAELVVFDKLIDKTKRFENYMQRALADAANSGNTKEYNRLLNMWEEYKEVGVKSNIKEFLKKMELLEEAKKVLSPEEYRTLRQSAWRAFYDVPKPEKAEKPSAIKTAEELRVENTGLPGVVKTLYPESTLKDGDFLFRMERARRAVEDYQAVVSSAQDLLKRGYSPEQAIKYVQKNLPADTQQQLNILVDGARRYILGVDYQTGKLKTDPQGRPRHELLKYINLDWNNFLDIIEFVDKGVSNADIIKYYRK